MDNKSFEISEAVGVPAIYAIATLLHFVYPLSGGSTLAIIFGAVNESVWEHLKIFTAGFCAWALLQLMWVKVPFKKYLAAKCCGLYLLMAGIAGFYYLYISIAGRSILLVDLISSAAVLAAAQFTSYRMTVGRIKTEDFFVPALLLIMLYYLMFFAFTVFPPQADIFRDPRSGEYGIISQELGVRS